MDPAGSHGTQRHQVAERGENLQVSAARQLWVRGFLWHLGVFAALNILLNCVNWYTGRPWWAFWPLVVTGLLLGLHYIFYKTAVIDEGWVRERTEEVNLKSYDRSHIEGLKDRYGGVEKPSQDPPR